MKCCSDKLKGEILDSVFVSFFLLMLFFLLQISPQNKMLDIKPLWVLIAFIPLIITIIFSGLIKSFKGFGIELETRFSEFNVIDTMKEIVFIPQPKTIKDLEVKLEEVSPEEIKDITRIQFTNNQKNYNTELVEEYFQKLNKLKYIEIVDGENVFLGLITIGKVYKESEPIKNIENFIKHIENGEVFKNYDVVTAKVNDKEDLLNAYKRFTTNNQGSEIIVVINDEKKMIGTISRSNITDKIAKNVLKLTQK